VSDAGCQILQVRASEERFQALEEVPVEPVEWSWQFWQLCLLSQGLEKLMTYHLAATDWKIKSSLP